MPVCAVSVPSEGIAEPGLHLVQPHISRHRLMIASPGICKQLSFTCMRCLPLARAGDSELRHTLAPTTATQDSDLVPDGSGGDQG
jgi:hypothetical protein